VPLIGAPELGEDHDVRVETLDDVERPGGSTPTVDAGVKVKRRDTHRSTLATAATVWQSLKVESVDVTFGHRLWWVDAFIGDRERGNPAVVVLLEHPCPMTNSNRSPSKWASPRPPSCDESVTSGHCAGSHPPWRSTSADTPPWRRCTCW
jgi:hypothetical protein